jgi:parallel beta-helix repeat protein
MAADVPNERQKSARLLGRNEMRCLRIRRRLWLQPLEDRTVPTTFNVSNTSDGLPAPAGSLRAAVAAANANPGADIISFGSGVIGTITLTKGEIAITDAVTITPPAFGGGSISGNNANRIFNTQSAPANALITISGLSFSGGLSNGRGGAILAGDESVVLNNCTFSGNNAVGTGVGFGGAVDMQFNGTLQVNNCNFTGNSAVGGGAITTESGSAVALQNCTISGNTASTRVGGLYFYNAKSVLIDGCTLSNNKAGLSGGGMVAGYFAPTGSVTVRNCTISGNSASDGGGIALFTFAGTLNIQNSTVTANNGGTKGGAIERVSGTGAINIDSSILYGDTGTTGPEIFTTGTTTVNTSLVQSKSGVNTFTGDTFTNANIGVDPLLAPLAKYGGPTQTCGLKIGSPALDHGSNPAGLTTDQRGTGFSRAFNGAPDIGSFEDQPATYVVTNANDSGAGSLRQAVLDANAFGSFTDSITFDPTAFNVPKTITLTTGLMFFTVPITITGPGATLLTISGNNASAIFDTDPAPAGSAMTFSGLTFTAGFGNTTGGAIFCGDEQVAVNSCNFTANQSISDHGGAINIFGGSLTVTDCSFVNNTSGLAAGAVYVTLGNASFLRCALAGNHGTTGGAVELNSVASAVFDSCSLTGNSATSQDGGAIGMAELSGGPATLTIRNSTISGNSAKVDGGGVGIAGNASISLTVQNSTITGNTADAGGGIRSIHPVTIESSIVFGNTAASYGADVTSTTVIVTSSLIGSKSTIGSFTGDAFTNSHIGANPLLGPLANLGGSTLVQALGAGSPAIDNGTNPANESFDQRGAGFARVSGGQIDIGAFERQPLVVTNANDSGTGSLRQMIAYANTIPGADVVSFDPTFFNVPRTITLTTGEIAMTDTLTLTGPGSTLLTVSGNSASRIFNTSAAPTGTSINISSATLVNGKVSGPGGAIACSGQVMQLSDCNLTTNSTAGSLTKGGAIYIGTGGALTATSCSFKDNVSSGNGGGIASDGNSLTLIRSTISGNRLVQFGQAYYGGGIYLHSGSLVVDSCTLSGNASNYFAGFGGAIYLKSNVTSATIRNSTISGNSTGGRGGAICCYAVTIQNSTITGNTAYSFSNLTNKYVGIGGGVDAVKCSIESSILYGNKSVDGPDIDVNTLTAHNTMLGQFPLIGVLIGDVTFGVDPMLGPLADNGGPTETCALLPGSPAINHGSNPANLTTDQRGSGFARKCGIASDIGAFEAQSGPIVTNVQINDGAVQRSRVTSVKVTFDQPVTLPAMPETAFDLVRQSDGKHPALMASVDNSGPRTVVTLSFTGTTSVDNGSLADGRYTLTVFAAKVSTSSGSLDGDGNGTGGDNYTLASETDTSLPPTNIFRYFGDSNGDGAVGANDFVLFRQSFNGVNYIFDFDNDGFVSASDFVQFRNRFGTSI